MSTIEHVRSFLAPIPLTDDFSRFAVARAEAAAADPRIAQLQAELRERIYGVQLRSETIRLHERLSNYGVNCELTGMPAFAATLLAAAYSRAKEGIRLCPIGTGTKSIASLTERSIAKYEELMASEPDFFDEMLMEVTVRAARDPGYAKQLQDNAAELAVLLSNLPSVGGGPVTWKPTQERLGDGWVSLGSLMVSQPRRAPDGIQPAAPEWAHKLLDLAWDFCVWVWDKLK